MYSYEFINKENVTLFRCLDEPYITIDKEDMVHILSVDGNWRNKNGVVRLEHHPNKERSKLSDYILNARGGDIRHINNNALDFRKKNLLVKNHNHTPYFIRPLSLNDVAIFPDMSDPDTLRFFHIIRKNNQPIGYFSVLPVHNSAYKQCFEEGIPKEKALSFATAYENDTDYYHIIYGHFPENTKLFSYIRAYYQNLLFHLRLRNIHIQEAMTFAGDSFSETAHQSQITIHANNPNIIRLNIQDL